MNQQIKNFTIKTNQNKKADNQPDRILCAKVGEAWVDIGAGFIKEDKNGNKYLSAVLANPYEGTNKEGLPFKREGYVIVSEAYLKQLESKGTTSKSEDFPDGLSLDDMVF